MTRRAPKAASPGESWQRHPGCDAECPQSRTPVVGLDSALPSVLGNAGLWGIFAPSS